jgi:hypothetical protein
MKIKRFFSFIIFVALLFSAEVFGQEKLNIKFGDVSAKDFAARIYSIDSNANAVVLADIGSTEIVGNTKGNFSLLFKRFRRIHVLNKNGFDIGNVEIGLYTSGENEEELDNLKAITYNMENGKVIETKLNVKADVFKDKVSKKVVIKKFTLPNIKEGSIIEYEYKIKSDFIFNLQPWEFQGEYPVLWSEYNVALPQFYYYVTITQGYHRFHIKDRKDRRGNFDWADTRGSGASERGSFDAPVSDYRWVMKDVPALKEESFTSTVRNHISKIEFQLAAIREPFAPKTLMNSWEEVAKDLMDDEDFGATLSKDNSWLNDIMPEAVKATPGKLDKAEIIYSYVRNNFTCTNYSRIWLDQPLKNVARTRSGSVAEINLLLTSMLRKAGVTAEPVLLSLRSQGYTHSLYPLVDRFNYVVTRIKADNKSFYLDASNSSLGFGKLGFECYNGHGRVINKMADAIDLNSDSLVERKSTSIFIINDEKGNLVGSVQQTPGYYESYQLRKRIKESGQEKLLADIKKAFGADIEISNPKIDSIEQYEHELGIKYDFDLKEEKSDIIYFNPLFGEGYKENPFKAAVRFYPVEMPYTMDETYNLHMEIPHGYNVDELPEQVVVKLNESGDGFFEYRVSSSGGNISLRSRVIFKRSYFLPEEYETLREFFNLIVKKQGEQIVFKKKK